MHDDRPSKAVPLALQLLVGAVCGAILGTANGLLLEMIALDGMDHRTVGTWGAGLGGAGGVVVAIIRRVFWGRDAGIEIGTILGVLYGIVPGTVLLFATILVHQVVFVSWKFVGLVMAASMIGLVIGGALDRIAETLFCRAKRTNSADSAD
ncbi:MAG: hypothetical protein JNM56_01255 [Planctomycetia bacterium]|nr:hypothetical protein [Planctomycetia bacterium]